MKIYIMRHGEAGYAAPSDAERPLTAFGKQQSIAVAKWLKSQHIEFDFALVSPYLRAQQTLAEIKQIIAVRAIETNNWLVPSGDSAIIAASMAAIPEKFKSVILVSHLPLVGYLVSDLCLDVAPPMFSTATIACVSIDKGNQGKLEWIHTAS